MNISFLHSMLNFIFSIALLSTRLKNGRIQFRLWAYGSQCMFKWDVIVTTVIIQSLWMTWLLGSKSCESWVKRRKVTNFPSNCMSPSPSFSFSTLWHFSCLPSPLHEIENQCTNSSKKVTFSKRQFFPLRCYVSIDLMYEAFYA
jgi:hypothetical protein